MKKVIEFVRNADVSFRRNYIALVKVVDTRISTLSLTRTMSTCVKSVARSLVRR
jgi:hypothetical protein